MIAALVLVALVAVAGQAQAMPEQRPHEVQPFFDPPDFTVGLRVLRCIVYELSEISAVAFFAGEHKAEMLEAGKQLAQSLASCAGADHKLDCIDKKIVEFLNAEHTPNVQKVLDNIGAINNRINKCVGH